MKYIQSSSNPKFKQYKKLLTKKGRDQLGLFLVEGFHLVEEAKNAQNVLEYIISDSSSLPDDFLINDDLCTMLPNDLFLELCDTQTPQGIIAVCSKQEAFVQKAKKYLFIDAVQDPGNLGTLIRTADASGMDAVILGNGTVDVYNQKVLRSAQGAHFHLPIVRGDLVQWIDKLLKEEIQVFGTALENGVDYRTVSPMEKFALIVGNEGSGMNPLILNQTTKNLYIPIYGKSESLNVAIAAGILMYHLRA